MVVGKVGFLVHWACVWSSEEQIWLQEGSLNFSIHVDRGGQRPTDSEQAKMQRLAWLVCSRPGTVEPKKNMLQASGFGLHATQQGQKLQCLKSWEAVTRVGSTRLEGILENGKLEKAMPLQRRKSTPQPHAVTALRGCQPRGAQFSVWKEKPERRTFNVQLDDF